MCKHCGCGLGKGDVKIGGHGYNHAHDNDHGYDHSHDHRTLSLNQSLMEKNDRLAQQNRELFRSKKLLVFNVVSSPGSGKTTFIRETAKLLDGRLRVAVIVGDLATDNDAAQFHRAGIAAVQITTGTLCHLDAGMVFQAASRLDLNQLDVLVIENVGNLVCPADYDLGEDLRVVLLSVTEGEDKPLKYPPMFHSAGAAILTKSDLSVVTGFDREQALANVKRISHHAVIFELSARTGAGMTEWTNFLARQHASLGRSAPGIASATPGDTSSRPLKRNWRALLEVFRNQFMS
jgi:hydrogenase nickel incorporation protein HypB